MIKVTEYILEKQLTEIKYPCLMKSGNGNVVLFRRSGVGTVLHCPTNVYNIGDIESDFDMSLFSIIDYPITLENQF